MKRSMIVAVLFLAAAALAIAVSAPAYAGRDSVAGAKFCNCPQVVDFVLCSNGQTYLNSCYATCDHQRNCVRIGP